MSALRDGTRGSSGGTRALVLGDRNETTVLERAGHVAAPTIDVALEELASGRFDCLLIDASGPRGVERLERLGRLREENPALPVVAFCEDDDARTADADVTDVVRAALGSFSAAELVDELAPVLGRRSGDAAGRHEAVAELGRRALEGAPLTALLERAVALVADALTLDRCGAFELVPDGTVLLREGVGWEPGAIDDLAIDANGDSRVGSPLSTGEPAVGVLGSEDGSDDPLASRGVESGISVVVGPAEEPWGILGAYASGPRTFDGGDVAFVRSVANVLAGAVERSWTDRRLETELEEVYGRVTDAFVALDSDARVTHLNDRAERLFGLPEERLMGRVIWEPFPEVFEETFREDYREAMEHQKPIERERYYPFLDRWYEGRASPPRAGCRSTSATSPSESGPNDGSARSEP